MEQHRDPVCGMDVSESDSEGTSEYQGQIYYFCSNSCKDQFDADPEGFAG